MTVVVNLRNEDEEKALYAFLDRLHYDYRTSSETGLTIEQEKEILRRDKAFEEDKTSARSWDVIKTELERVYR